jgi:hypothetical protein
MILRLVTLSLLIVCAAGCATSPRHRPIVRDERGAQVSQVTFPSDQREVVLPLTFDGRLLFTDAVKINGQNVGTFIVDTGAMVSVLDRAAALKLGLTPDKCWSAMAQSQPRPDGLYRIDSLDAGGVSIRNHVIGVVDLSSVRRGSHRQNIAGVIGADVWATMPFTIDYQQRQLIFHARQHFRPPTGSDSVESSIALRDELKVPDPFARANPRAGAPIVPVKINGEVVDGVIDTGSGGSIMLLPKLVLQRPDWIRGDRFVARAAGAGGAIGLAGYGLMGANVESVDALGVRFSDIDSALAIIDVSPRDQASVILGTRLLSHMRLTFDYANEKVWAEVK